MNKVEWISAKDRLPEEGTPVLVVRPIYTLKEMYVAFLENGKWCDNYFGREIALEADKKITHWAELPELPFS